MNGREEARERGSERQGESGRKRERGGEWEKGRVAEWQSWLREREKERERKEKERKRACRGEGKKGGQERHRRGPEECLNAGGFSRMEVIGWQ